MGQSTTALASACRVRDQFIDLTYELPQDAPSEVLGPWNAADTALLAFVRALEALDA